jgi:CHASE3 domain sensor protein
MNSAEWPREHRLRWSVGTKIAAGFGLAIAIFLLVNAASYRATSELIGAAEQRKQTYVLLAELDAALPLLKDVESSGRYYVLTDDETYLQQSRAAADRVPLLLRRLRQLTMGQPL